MKTDSLCLWGVYYGKKYENSGYVCVESIKVRSMNTQALFVWSLLR